jgi:hypothetical protein
MNDKQIIITLSIILPIGSLAFLFAAFAVEDIYYLATSFILAWSSYLIHQYL